MKIIAFFIMVTLVHVQATTYGQKVSLNFENASLSEVLEEIQRQTGYDFLYNSALIDQKNSITIKTKETDLKKVLTNILSSRDLSFEVDRSSVLIKRGKKPTHLVEVKGQTIEKEEIQQRVISGTVRDALEEPVSGVTVTAKESNVKASTDEAGTFSISVEAEDKVLFFSSVGYISQEIAIGSQTVMNVVLQEQVGDLEEVVVVGYGTQKKSDLTGSIVSLQEDKFTKGTNTNAFQLLNGKVSGVSISQTSSAPGASTKIQIRGAGSINSSNAALVVVDGLPGVNPASLSMDDVETIDILKDASAAAIYGTRAANGVVIITTKKGAAGKTVTQYSNYFGVQNASKRLEVLNGEQYMRTLNSIREESGKDPIYTQEEINKVGVGTNWQDEVFRNSAPVMNHQLSFSGGGENSRFYSGLTYYDQDGLVKNSGIKKINLRANAEFTPKSFLKFTINANYTNSRNQSIYTSNSVNENAGPLNSALQFDPTLSSGLDENGRYYLNNFIALDNPLALINGIDNYSNSQTFYGLVSAEVKPFKGFTTTFRFGGRATTSMSSAYTDRSTINGLSRGG